MRTLYVDVYFLINFTVDILAFYFALIFSKCPAKIHRIIISSLLGAFYAVFATVYIGEKRASIFFSLVVFVIMILIISKGIGIYRKVKLSVAFFLFQILIGGLVYYGYGVLDRLFEDFEYTSTGGENKRLLLLSLIILLAIGFLKLVISFLGSVRSEKIAKISIDYLGSEFWFDALVDTGNLAVDPLDKTPVMLINSRLSKRIFGFEILKNHLSIEDSQIKKRIRIIPASFGGNKKILYGIKPDAAYAITKKKKEKISIVIAINNDENNFGGYDALIPFTALEDVFYDIG